MMDIGVVLSFSLEALLTCVGGWDRLSSHCLMVVRGQLVQ